MGRCWSSPSHCQTRYVLVGTHGQEGAGPWREGHPCFIFVLQVSVIKVKIHEATGMPAGKQKLQYEVSWACPMPHIVTSMIGRSLEGFPYHHVLH